MVNTDAWDRIAARLSSTARAVDVVHYGPDLPTERDLRLCGDVAGHRVLDLGCRSGENAVAFARQGAHVIALDQSSALLALGQRLAEEAETRVEWHRGDLADLAFLRADSIDLVFSAGAVAEIEDLDRLLRQVHRVLRPGAAFLFSHDHPVELCIGRDPGEPGGLPLGRLEVRRSYFEPGPLEVERQGETLLVWPRTVSAVFAALHRAAFRVDALLEPEPAHSTDPGPALPAALVWRARKEGV